MKNIIRLFYPSQHENWILIRVYTVYNFIKSLIIVSKQSSIGDIPLTWRQVRVVHELLCFSNLLFRHTVVQGGSRQGHHTGTGNFQNTKWLQQQNKRGDPRRLCRQLHNDIAVGNVHHLAAKTLGDSRNVSQVQVLSSQGLRGRQVAWVESTFGGSQVWYGAVTTVQVVGGNQLSEVLRAQQGNTSQQQLTLDDLGVRVVQHSIHGHQVLNLATRSLDNSVTAAQNNRHPRQILDFGVANHKRVNVEASGG
ncbi:conserved hypothetical protein [Clavispora lusitaniae ATCC 42720]|uniref:Uncharacterized protein n=1 Tax=Clavispora lusitaniae (strain ATCC 42720) TaxID=306902 RepID=C4Y186_CLAL4|nr:uncharacterized protein CLUG_01968 [Clavispora lusitaniae ATCC 42720]EEQ37845.1 conserved hypothetical protein [Clavispora lusitaniae ATCC 42720]